MRQILSQAAGDDCSLAHSPCTRRTLAARRWPRRALPGVSARVWQAREASRGAAPGACARRSRRSRCRARIGVNRRESARIGPARIGASRADPGAVSLWFVRNGRGGQERAGARFPGAFRPDSRVALDVEAGEGLVGRHQFDHADVDVLGLLGDHRMVWAMFSADRAVMSFKPAAEALSLRRRIAVNSVSTMPGSIALTRTPSRAGPG